MINKLAWREIRNNPKFSFFFILNFTIGLIGLLLLFTFKESLSTSLQGRSKEILTADFSAYARRILSSDEVENFEKKFPTTKFERQREVSLYTMGYKSDGFTKLVQLRGIEKTYPFWGELTFENNEVFTNRTREELQNNKEVWLYQETASQFNLKVGQYITLANKQFKVSKIVINDTSDTSMGFSLAPRIYIGLDNLLATKLASSKSTLFDHRLYLFKESIDLGKLRLDLNGSVKDNTIKFKDPETEASGALRAFGTVNDYLSLVALVAFFLAALGVNYLVQNYIEKKKKNVAILKTLGMSELKIFQLYLMQIFVLAIFSWIISSLSLFILTFLINKFLPADLTIQLTVLPFILGLIMSVVTSLLIALPFLKELNDLEPVILLKQIKGVKQSTIASIFYSLPMVVFFGALAVFLSHSYKIGIFFILGLSCSFLIFKYIAFLLLYSLKKVSTKNLQIKLFAKNASRNATQFSSAITALGIGVLLFNVLPTIEQGLSLELSSPDKNRIPSLFLLDIDEDELPLIEEHLSNLGTPLKGQAPMIRAKLKSINGIAFEKSYLDKEAETREQERERWARNRGFNLTYPINAEDSEYELTTGRGFSGAYDFEDNKDIEVIIEERFAGRLDIELGDKLVFDIQGVDIQTVIIGTRKVKWTTFRPNFFVSLQPNSMVDAPKSFIGVTEKVSNKKRSEVLLSLAQKFPNVSVVDITRNVGKLLKLIDFLGLVFKALSLMSIFTGMIIISSLANYEAYKRINEINLLKVLGMEESRLHKLNLIHYGFLGGVSSLLGVFASLVMSYILLVVFFDGLWAPQPSLLIMSVFSVILLTQFISWISVRNVYKKAPSSLFETL